MSDENHVQFMLMLTNKTHIPYSQIWEIFANLLIALWRQASLHCTKQSALGNRSHWVFVTGKQYNILRITVVKLIVFVYNTVTLLASESEETISPD